MSANTQPVREAVRLTLILLPITSAVAVVMSVIFAFLYSHKLTRPIGQMLSVTREMEELERDAAVPIESGDELGMLAERINQLYRRLWQTIQSLEQEKAHISRMERNKLDFLRSASHELKTPLAGLRILLENMKYNVGRYKDHETYLQEAMDMVDRLSLMLRDILDASRNQAESGSKERLKIPEELAAVWQDYELMARAEGLSVDIQIEPGLEVEMDRTQFRRLWSNLFSNAVRYTENGGHISIRGGAGELSVWNSCTPIPPEQAERLFEAFYRPDFARSSADGGSGLGLYLVKGILDANRLPCSFVPDGEGMRFTMGLAPN